MGSPSGRRPSTAAGTVADVLTTSRSPACEERTQLGEACVHRRGVAHAHEQPHVVASPAASLGRLVRLVRGVEHEVQTGGRGGGVDHGCLDPAGVKARALYRPLGTSLSMSATRPGTLSLGFRSVGDVLARERVLVHLGAHVTRVDDEHA